MHDGIPFQERMRWRIASRIRDGILPRRGPDEVLTGRGDGGTCDGCGERITRVDAQVEATFVDCTLLHFHRSCYMQWNARRGQL